MSSDTARHRTYNGFENLLLLLGRLFMAVLVLREVWYKYTRQESVARYFADNGLPVPDILVMLTFGLGGLLILMLVAGFCHRLVALLLIIYFAIGALFIDIPNMNALLEASRHNMLFAFDMFVIGAALYYLVTGPGEWSVRQMFRGNK